MQSSASNLFSEYFIERGVCLATLTCRDVFTLIAPLNTRWLSSGGICTLAIYKHSHLVFYWPICCRVAYCMKEVAWDSHQWFPSIQPSALLLIATTSSSSTTTSAMLVINCVPKMTYGGEKPSSSSAFSFMQRVREWEPDNRKSNWAKGGLEERGVIAVVGSRAIMFNKMGPSNPVEHFSQRLPKYAVWGEAGWEKKTDLSLGGLLFLLPSYQVTVNKLLSIYSGISSWVPKSEGLIDGGVNKGCSPPLAVTIVREGGGQ